MATVKVAKDNIVPLITTISLTKNLYLKLSGTPKDSNTALNKQPKPATHSRVASIATTFVTYCRHDFERPMGGDGVIVIVKT